MLGGRLETNIGALVLPLGKEQGRVRASLAPPLATSLGPMPLPIKALIGSD